MLNTFRDNPVGNNQCFFASEEAIQEAWLAVAEGRKPDSAVRALVRHEQKHNARKPNFDYCPTGRVLLRF